MCSAFENFIRISKEIQKKFKRISKEFHKNILSSGARIILKFGY